MRLRILSPVTLMTSSLRDLIILCCNKGYAELLVEFIGNCLHIISLSMVYSFGSPLSHSVLSYQASFLAGLFR